MYTVHCTVVSIVVGVVLCSGQYSGRCSGMYTVHCTVVSIVVGVVVCTVVSIVVDVVVYTLYIVQWSV